MARHILFSFCANEIEGRRALRLLRHSLHWKMSSYTRCTHTTTSNPAAHGNETKQSLYCICSRNINISWLHAHCASESKRHIVTNRQREYFLYIGICHGGRYPWPITYRLVAVVLRYFRNKYFRGRGSKRDLQHSPGLPFRNLTHRSRILKVAHIM